MQGQGAKFAGLKDAVEALEGRADVQPADLSSRVGRRVAESVVDECSQRSQAAGPVVSLRVDCAGDAHLQSARFGTQPVERDDLSPAIPRDLKESGSLSIRHFVRQSEVLFYITVTQSTFAENSFERLHACNR